MQRLCLSAALLLGLVTAAQATPDGQLWYTTGLSLTPPALVGHINSDGSAPTITVPTTQGTGVVGVAVDPAAGFYWLVDAATGPAFGTHSSDPTACSLLEYSISTNTLVRSLKIGDDADQDEVEDVVVDPVQHILYVQQWGVDKAHSGIQKVPYDPVTGVMTGGFGNATFLVNNSNFSGLDDVRYMAIDVPHQKLYFSDNDNGYCLSPFSPSNAVFGIDLQTANAVPTQLTSNANVAGGFPPGSASSTGCEGGGTAATVDPNGLIGAVTVDPSTGLVYFLTHEFSSPASSGGGTNPGQDALWYVNSTTATQVATKVSGVTINYAGENGGLSFDPQTRQLWISDQDQRASNNAHILVSQLSADGHSATTVASYPMSVLTGTSSPDQDAVPQGTAFVTLPKLAVTGTTTHVVEQSGAIALAAALTISDANGGGYLTGAAVQVTGGTFSGDGDALSVNGATSGTVAGTNIVVSYNSGSQLLTLAGYDTFAHYTGALDAVKLAVNSDNPANYGNNPTRTISWLISNGLTNITGATQTTATTTVTIDGVNDPPTLAGTGTIAYTELQAAVVIASSLTVSDPDNLNLNGATVSIASGFVAGDTLNFVNQNGISGSYASATGVLSLSGAATLANYQSAMRSITFDSTSDNPTNFGANPSRTVAFVGNDGIANGTAANATINVSGINNAPSVVAGATTSYTESAVPVAIDATMTVSDPDSANLAGATIAISGGFVTGDLLGFVNQNGISGSYDAGTHVLSLSGSTSVANYQSALQAVAFSSSSANPTVYGTQVSRTIQFTVSDGSLNSTAASATVNVVAVNNAPTNTLPGPQFVRQDTNLAIAGISIADVDADPANDGLTTTLSVAHGTLTASAFGGASLTGNGTATLTVSGSQNAINATLAAAGNIVYRNAAQFAGFDTLTVTTNDNGHTGSGGAQQTTNSIQILVADIIFKDGFEGQ